MSVALVESSAALQSMRNSDFDAYSAYGEIVDNSLQAEAKNIFIEFKYIPAIGRGEREPIEYIAFGDDGLGMNEEILHRCLQLGYSSRYNDRSGIGRFGVGAILASINQCMKIEVYSKRLDGNWLYTFVDLEKITKGTMDSIPDPTIKEPPSSLNNLCGDDSGTLVVWSKYDRQPTDASEMIDEFRVWVGRTYRHFIWEGIKIHINRLEVKSIDPLYARVDNTNFPGDPKALAFEPIVIPWPIPPDDRIPGGPERADVTIRMSLLPEEFRPNQGSGSANSTRDRYIDKNDGISIIRNNREVFFGRIPYWPGQPFQEIDRWWGCEVSFDAVLDKEFTVKNIKRGAVPVKELKKLLSDKIEPTRKTSLVKVREVWNAAKAQKKVQSHDATTITGHEEAEDVAKATKIPLNVIDRGKNIDDESKKYTEGWINHLGEQEKSRWREKFKGQPFTIIDEEWRGPEFFETAHLGGKSVLKYNMRHKFFSNIESIRMKLEEDDADNDSAQKLKLLLDLLLISNAKAEAMFDGNLEMSAERFIEQMRMNWGNYLSNYIDTFEKDS